MNCGSDDGIVMITDTEEDGSVYIDKAVQFNQLRTSCLDEHLPACCP